MIQSSRELLLALLYAPGRGADSAEPVTGITRIEKLAFLASRYDSLRPVFEQMDFQPDNFGPFSETVQDDLEYLRTLGLVEFKELENKRPRYDDLSREDSERSPPTRYKLTPKGKSVAEDLWGMFSRNETKAVEEIKKKYNHLPLNQLIRFVYRTSDRVWTSKSAIADQYL